MPLLVTGALFADTPMTGIDMSGDGDAANSGVGQINHVVRHNFSSIN